MIIRAAAVVGTILALLLYAGVVKGEEAGSVQSTNSSTSISSEWNNGEKSQSAPAVAVELRPFQPILPRDHLFSDWRGLRLELEQIGITPTLTYVSDIAGNPSGGNSQGITHADNVGLDFLLDLDKLVGLEGGSFEVSASYRYGNSLSQDRIGNAFTVQQVYGGDTFKLIDVAYRQKIWDDRFEVRAGRVAAGDDFFVSAPDYLFMQNAFDGNPVAIFKNAPGMTAYPNASWGGLVDFKPTKRTYIMAGIYDGDPGIREIDHNGVDMSIHGPAFAIAEAGYCLNGLPGDSRYLGDYKAGAWYDNASFADYKTEGYENYEPSASGLSMDLVETPSQMKRGNWGFYAMFDQVVLPFGDPAKNFGVMIFGAVLVSPEESVSQMPFFADGGILCRGMFPSRPRDVTGFGIIYGDFSSDLRHAEEREEALAPALGVGVQDYESVLEWTYKLYFHNGALFVQPDAQYIIRPGGTGKIDDAIVLGAQVGINF